MTPSPPSKTPEEIAELIEALTGQHVRSGNVAHTLWTRIWQQLNEIRKLLLVQTTYLEFFLTEHLKYSTDEIDEFVARTRSAERGQTAESPDDNDTTSED